ncbi:YozQ family protein [Bacillus sp. FJAT-27445]|uniref:YozQ family protein n=1 Tax=Bacillus sp. FJAT-27445 TaxID=1679166 RepID=UPI0009E8F0A7|nr:YozQ family protein [Bacillus sp. FJAT-27445]
MDKREKSIAERIYDPSDYKKKDEVSSGLAETHEQVSDVYMEGEIGGKIERPDGGAEELPR